MNPLAIKAVNHKNNLKVEDRNMFFYFLMMTEHRKTTDLIVLGYFYVFLFIL